MLGGDQRIRMVYSLMFSLPGTPVLFYGEEIGMGENLAIEGPDERARADAVVGRAQRLASAVRNPALPPGDRGGVRPRARQRVRATARPRLAAQLDGAADPATARVPRARVGPLPPLSPRETEVFAHRCDWDDSTVVAVRNLAGHDVETRRPIEGDGALVDLFGSEDLEPPFTVEGSSPTALPLVPPRR